MTDREVMQQAIDALEVLAKYEHPQTKIQVRKKDGSPIVTMYPHKVASDAAQALRAALAEPVQDNRLLMQAYRAVQQQKEQRTEPEQEPVAYVDERIHGWPDCFVMRPDPPHTKPVYAHPPQRKPLTTMEIVDLMPNQIPADYDKWLIDFAREIERAIKQEEAK